MFVLLHCLVAMLTIRLCVTASATCVENRSTVVYHLLGILSKSLCVEVVCTICF